MTKVQKVQNVSICDSENELRNVLRTTSDKKLKCKTS